MADTPQIPTEPLGSLLSGQMFDIVPMGQALPTAEPLPEQSPEVIADLERPRKTRDAIRSRLQNMQSAEDSKSEIV